MAPSLFETLPMAAPGAVTCAYLYRSGRRCREAPDAQAEDGLCKRHGGGLTACTTEAITKRLLDLRYVGVDTLEEMMIYAFDERVRVSATMALFDRTGHGPKSTIEIEKHETDFSTLTDEQIAASIADLQSRLSSLLSFRRMNGEPLLTTDVATTH